MIEKNLYRKLELLFKKKIKSTHNNSNKKAFQNQISLSVCKKLL